MRNTPTPSTTRPTLGRPVLSQTAEHALRATLYLGRSGSGSLVSAREVAEALGTPANYTGKTLRQLARKGVLRSTRGREGGFALAVRPEELTIADIVDAVDEAPLRTAVCLLGDRPCSPGTPCEAHVRWTEVRRRASELLERTTLAELLGGAPASAP